MSRCYSIDELSRMAGERWALEDAERGERRALGDREPDEAPRRARPRVRLTGGAHRQPAGTLERQ